MNNIYEDIAKRTQGDIYIGVVGPVRTGKSTFIRKFMENLVLPNIENEFKRERTQDEIPQSGSGKTIMTVEPKFVPADGVEIKIKDTVSLKVRMVDCVGYIVDGALGHEEEGKQRLVSTPWSQEAMTFEKAAEIGTKKVIRDHSTLGIVVLTDGSVTGIDRKNYLSAEERVINELKSLNKPFAVVLNTLEMCIRDRNISILSNRDYVKQIFLNLIDNAIKYTPENKDVYVEVYYDKNNLVIKVGDNGIGIPKEDIKRIFERFYRVDKARSREVGGTGLGLAITKHIVKNLDGTINVKSELGQGSEFIITIPKKNFLK